MMFIFGQIAAMASADAAKAELQRQRNGGQPLEVKPKLLEQLAREKREDFWAQIGFWFITLIWAIPFVALPTLFVYVVIKFMFAKQGIKWP